MMDRARKAAFDLISPRWTRNIPHEDLDSLADAFRAFGKQIRAEERAAAVKWMRDSAGSPNVEWAGKQFSAGLERGDHVGPEACD